LFSKLKKELKFDYKGSFLGAKFKELYFEFKDSTKAQPHQIAKPWISRKKRLTYIVDIYEYVRLFVWLAGFFWRISMQMIVSFLKSISHLTQIGCINKIKLIKKQSHRTYFQVSTKHQNK